MKKLLFLLITILLLSCSKPESYRGYDYWITKTNINEPTKFGIVTIPKERYNLRIVNGNEEIFFGEFSKPIIIEKVHKIIDRDISNNY